MVTDLITHPIDSAISLDRLRIEAIELGLSARAASTIRRYETARRGFDLWCAAAGLQSFPSAPETLALYLTHCMKIGRKAATLSVALAAISYFHKRYGHPNPAANLGVLDVMRGIRRTIGVAPNQKAAATADVIAAMLAHLPNGVRGARDRAVLLLGMSGAFRRSELAALDIDDLEFTNAGLDVTIRRSKTDQEGRGQQVSIPDGRHLFPVQAVKEWLAVSGITRGPVFRSVSATGRLGRKHLCDRSVADIVKYYAALIGLEAAEFSGHSLRSGFVTSAAAAGVDLTRIMDQTRHTDLRSVQRYVRRAKRYRDHPGASFL
jgi:integrase